MCGDSLGNTYRPDCCVHIVVVLGGIQEGIHQCQCHYDPQGHQCLDPLQASLVGYRAPDLDLGLFHHPNLLRHHRLVDRDMDVVFYTETLEEWDLLSPEEVVVGPIPVHSLGDHLDVEGGVDDSVCFAGDNLSVVAWDQGFPNPLLRQTHLYDHRPTELVAPLWVAVDHHLLHQRQCESLRFYQSGAAGSHVNRTYLPPAAS